MEDIQSLLDHGHVEDAVQQLKQLSLSKENVWHLVRSQLGKKRYDRASRVMETIDPNVIDKNYVAQFVMLALAEAQFALAIKWSLFLDGAQPTPQGCVKVAIDRDMTEVALKFIAELDLQEFDVRALIGRLCKQENFTSARKYAQRFGLEDVFSAEVILEMMMQSGQWENALNLKNQVPKLKEKLTGLVFLQRIIQSRDWVSAVKYSEQFGIPAKSRSASDLNNEKRMVVRTMIDGMIRDGKLYQAMRLVAAHHFDTEFPPKQLIGIMIKERQYAHALRFIKALNFEEDFAVELPSIHRERIRDLIAFRQLMTQRRKEARGRLWKPDEPMVVVANIFLGARTLQKRPDGKLFPVILGEALAGLNLAGSETADDDDEEEIVFTKRTSSQNPPRNIETQRPQGTIQQQFIPTQIRGMPFMPGQPRGIMQGPPPMMRGPPMMMMHPPPPMSGGNFPAPPMMLPPFALPPGPIRLPLQPGMPGMMPPPPPPMMMPIHPNSNFVPPPPPPPFVPKTSVRSVDPKSVKTSSTPSTESSGPPNKAANKKVLMPSRLV